MAFRNVWKFNEKTEKALSITNLLLAYPFVAVEEAERRFREDIRNGYVANLPTTVKEKFMEEQGIVVNPVNVLSLNVSLEKTTALTPQLTWTYVYKVIVDGEVEFYSEKLLTESPIATWVIPLLDMILKWVVALIVAYFVIQAIQNVLSSMVTKKTVIETYDTEGNLIEKKTVIEPDPTTIAIIAIGGLLGLGLVLYWLVGKPKG